MGWRGEAGGRSNIRQIGYIYSVIHLFTIHHYVLGPVLRGWGLPLVTDSELEGLECQTKELGINAEAKGATEVVVWEEKNGAGRVKSKRLGSCYTCASL